MSAACRPGDQGRPLILSLTARNSGALYTGLVSVVTSWAAMARTFRPEDWGGTAMFTTAVRPPDGPGITWIGGTRWAPAGKAVVAAPSSHPLGPWMRSLISVPAGLVPWMGTKTGYGSSSAFRRP